MLLDSERPGFIRGGMLVGEWADLDALCVRFDAAVEISAGAREQMAATGVQLEPLPAPAQ